MLIGLIFYLIANWTNIKWQEKMWRLKSVNSIGKRNTPHAPSRRAPGWEKVNPRSNQFQTGMERNNPGRAKATARDATPGWE
jgi:hypothetical protein